VKTAYFTRDIESRVLSAARQFPAVLVTGARQAGKSTLLRHLFPKYRYVSLDDPQLRALGTSDPALFLSTNPPPVIIDGIQYAPQLLPHIKMRIDAHRRAAGQYHLNGSQVFQLLQGISETLAGRIAVFNLYPFSWKELAHAPGRNKATDDVGMAKQLVAGFYPEQLTMPDLDSDLWYGSYIATYLERDIRNIRRVGDLGLFQKFVALLATRAGSLLNLSEVAKECGVAQPTARAWLTILEATYLVYLLKPYHANVAKRTIKAPKLYFIDTGLLCYLLGIDSAARFFKAAERGGIFENMVVIEALKQSAAGKGKTGFFYYKTSNGLEVDLIIEHGGQRRAYEIKLSKTVSTQDASGLVRARKDIGYSQASVLCLREEPVALAKNIFARHWSSIA